MANAKIRYDGYTEDGDKGSVYQDVGSVNASGYTETSEQNFGAIPFPEYQVLSDVNTTAAAGVLATLSNSLSYNMTEILVTAFTATTLDITVSLDGVTFSVAGQVLASPNNPNTAAAAIAGTGIYYLQGRFDTIVLTQAGAGGVTAQYSQVNI